MNKTIDETALDAYLAATVKELGLPGVAVALHGPQGYSFERGYGYRDLDRKITPDANTIFGIASMGKSITALCVCILAAEGKLSLDDPVNLYVPDFRVPGNPPEDETILNLATHRSGIPPMEPLEWSICCNTPDSNTDYDKKMQAASPNKMETLAQVVDYIAHCPYETLGEAGQIMSYSNEGYAVLCGVVDAAAGMPLEEFMRKRVFQPLGMNRSVLDQDAAQARVIASDGNITSLFEKNEDGTTEGDDNWSILPPFRGCACVKSTAHDMARYYQCLANRGVLDGRQVLPAQAVEYLIGSRFPEGVQQYYCMGLNKRVYEGHVLCEHSGGLHGVSSEGALFKDENYGFAVLCNCGDQDVEPLIAALENAVLGLPLGQSHAWLFPTGHDFGEPEMLTGTYIGHEGIPSVVKVFLQDGHLAADRDGTIYSLRHCGGTWFQLVDQKGKVQSRLHFWVRNGSAWGVQVYTRVFRRADPDC